MTEKYKFDISDEITNIGFTISKNKLFGIVNSVISDFILNRKNGVRSNIKQIEKNIKPAILESLNKKYSSEVKPSIIENKIMKK